MAKSEFKNGVLFTLKWLVVLVLFLISGSFSWTVVNPESFFGGIIFIIGWAVLFIVLFTLLTRYRRKYLNN